MFLFLVVDPDAGWKMSGHVDDDPIRGSGSRAIDKLPCCLEMKSCSGWKTSCHVCWLMPEWC